MRKIINGNQVVMGTCYYPEHWPESLWEDDLKRMLAHGITVIRIAEFAWSKIEPTEGNFTYEFYDRFLELAEKVGMKVIFCTPTATPPAWLTEKYPEVLNANMDGVLYRHGARRHYNYNSPVYLEKTRIIVEKSAFHYAPYPAVIGWQIDNELNCEKDVFYSESDSAAFRIFLKAKYKNLDALNEAWGTVFWNQTYTDWDEIHVPRTTYSDSTNPHEVLDYTRFISASARAYAKLQSDILRKYIKPEDFITTNGIFGNLDNHQMTAESLDFMTYDSYPNFAYTKEDYEKFSRTLGDRMWSRNPFRGSFRFSYFWNYGAAVRSQWLEYQNGGSHAQARTDDSLDDAECCPWSGLCQLLPMENMHDGNGDLLAWNTGLFGTG